MLQTNTKSFCIFCERGTNNKGHWIPQKKRLQRSAFIGRPFAKYFLMSWNWAVAPRRNAIVASFIGLIPKGPSPPPKKHISKGRSGRCIKNLSHKVFAKGFFINVTPVKLPKLSEFYVRFVCGQAPLDGPWIFEKGPTMGGIYRQKLLSLHLWVSWNWAVSLRRVAEFA